MRKWSAVVVFFAFFGLSLGQLVDTLLYLEDFDSWIPSGWDVWNLDGVPGSNYWYQHSVGGENVAAIDFSATYYSDDWLVTPTIDASSPADSVILYFWEDFAHFGGELGSSYVLISPDDGTTWPDTVKIYTNWTSSGSETGNRALHIESATLTSTTKIAFVYKHMNGLYWYVDKVEVISYASEPYPPVFTHSPYYRPAMPHTYTAFPETVDINDLTGVSSADICYDVDSSGSYTCIPMTYIGTDPDGRGLWVGNIPAQPAWSKIQYYFRATDSFSPPSTGYSDTFELVVQGDYYAFDDVDVDPEAPDTEWIDVSALPGAYRIDDPWTATSDDSLVPLPFTFKFYGIDYNAVYVHMAGFLRFGDLGTSFDPSNNQNFPDADPTGPNGVIAGMWDEFMATASVGGDVWVYDGGDTFIVMYENMGWIPPGGGAFWNALSMEILLLNPAICSEPGGNGEIIVKYRTISTDSIMDYSTVGVENETGELGMTYLFDGIYDPNAAGIVEGRAIKFTTTPPLYAGVGGVIIGWADLTDTPPVGDPGIRLELIPAGLTTTAGAGGRFVFTGVAPGTYIVKGEFVGYNYDATALLEVFEGETTYADTLYLTPLSYYVEDFEDGSEPGSAPYGGWEWGEYSVSSYAGLGTPPAAAHSGTRMWGTILHDDYVNDADWWLILPTGPTVVTFWHYYDAESYGAGWSFDGGQVLYSEDNGLSWTVAHPIDGYDDFVDALSDSGFTDNSGGWVQDSVDLRGTAATHIAFRFASDFSAHDYAGWYVDDVLTALREDKYGEVDGYVYDAATYEPIAGALVFADGDSDVTDAYGHFHLDNVVVGEQTIYATAPGYIPNSRGILVGRGSVTRTNIPLTPVSIDPEGGLAWDLTAGADDSVAVTICNPSDDTIYIWAELIGSGGGLMRALGAAGGHTDISRLPHALPFTPENFELAMEKASLVEPPRSKPAPSAPTTREAGYELFARTAACGAKAGELAIVDSINVIPLPTIAAPWTVGCRGLAAPYDYWITSMDFGTWESFNVEFDLAKNPTGTIYSTYPFTNFYYTPGDVAYDGRWFWQSVPGKHGLYAWDPNTGELVDSLMAFTGCGWDTTIVWGVGYDPVDDVFYLGDTLGVLWEVAGTSWPTPGEALAAWLVNPPTFLGPDIIFGVAFDPARRTVWVTSYWYETITEWNPNLIAGWLFQTNQIDASGFNLYGMEVGADRKLWVAVEDYIALYYQVYGYGLPSGYYPAGMSTSPVSLTLGPGECGDIVIRTSEVTPPGQYSLTLGIQVGNEEGIWTDWLRYPVVINVSPALHRGWNLVSFPVAATPNNVYTQLSDDIVPFENDATSSEIYAWDPEHGMFVVPEQFERGRGYYLWSWYDNTHIDVAGTPYYDAFTLTLPYYASAALPGWNLVGNPVNTEVDWDAIVSSPSFYGIYPTYYTLTPTGWASYSPGFPAGATRYIDPYVGFFVLVQPGETGVLPFGDDVMVRPLTKLAAATTSLPGFTLRLSVQAGDAFDRWNYIGTRYGASDDFDAYFDAALPPEVPGLNDIATLICGDYQLLRDIKAPLDDGDAKSWNLHIEGIAGGTEVVISWPLDHTPDLTDASQGINQIYGGYQLDLYDPATGEHIDMRSTNVYSFVYDGPRTLVITVSAGALGASDQSKLPKMFALHRNVPNPFNAKTEISFDVPAEAFVTVDVLDVSGHTVKTLAKGTFAAGRHTVVWDGTDEAGLPVGSGVYFCRMRAGDKVEVVRMTLVK